MSTVHRYRDFRMNMHIDGFGPDDLFVGANGRFFRVEIERDDCARAPWEECDGHGPVSEWTTRDKAPGELILVKDRRSQRYYDFAGAVRQARREGWGVAQPPEGATKGQIAAMAARQDYACLRAWCNDEWHYVTVTVTDPITGEHESLGRVESDDEVYLAECACNLADELAASQV